MSKLTTLLMLAEMLGVDLPDYGRSIHRCKDPLEGIDLVKEGELIRQKKSKLSANQRRRVMWELSRINTQEAGHE